MLNLIFIISLLLTYLFLSFQQRRGKEELATSEAVVETTLTVNFEILKFKEHSLEHKTGIKLINTFYIFTELCGRIKRKL